GGGGGLRGGEPKEETQREQAKAGGSRCRGAIHRSSPTIPAADPRTSSMIVTVPALPSDYGEGLVSPRQANHAARKGMPGSRMSCTGSEPAGSSGGTASR